jgi:hypothetical protein
MKIFIFFPYALDINELMVFIYILDRIINLILNIYNFIVYLMLFVFVCV